MKIKVTEKARVIMDNPTSLHKYFGWPTAMRLQNGKIAVAASGFRLGHVCPFGKAVISYSEDEGKTYTRPAIVIDTVLDDRDGGLCTFGDKGVVFTSFTDSMEEQIKYLDGHIDKRSEQVKNYVLAYVNAVTPEQQEQVLGSTFKISRDCGVTFDDKIYMSSVSSPHGPIELQDGTILWVGTVTKPDGKPEYRLRACTLNTDNGSMTEIGAIENVTDEEGNPLRSCEPYAVQLKDGTIVCHIRMEPEFSTFQTISKDNGKTWTKPERILPNGGGAPAFLYEHSSGVLISVYGYRRMPYGIKAMFSKDGGKTWDTDNTIWETDASYDLGYPSVVELKDGSLLTVFYARERRNDPSVIMQTVWKFEE